MQTKGSHVTADVWINESETLMDERLIENLAESIKASGLSIMGYKGHKFNDNGAFTCAWILAESHFTIHTFPERNFLSLDCYTCGDNGKPLQAIAEVMQYFEVSKANIKVFERGA
tara:strand:- start:1536 stop:1880 length:345 start_codon:yes stop_codon:yes gene_type:complete